MQRYFLETKSLIWIVRVKGEVMRVYVSGVALIDAGEAMRELGEVKDALDMEVKQNFIDPLQILHDKDLKEIQVLRPYHITGFVHVQCYLEIYSYNIELLIIAGFYTRTHYTQFCRENKEIGYVL